MISQSPSKRLSMPEKVRNALQGAIDARQRFCKWFERIKLPTESHRYFVTVLKTALNELSRKSDSGKPEAEASSGGGIHLEKDATFIKNAFEALEIEDITEEQPLSVDDVVQPDASASRETCMYQLDIDRQAEVAFILFSFLEDLHRLRTELKKLWARFRGGEIDLSHATCLTAAALEIVHNSEKEAYDAYAIANEPTENTYAAFLDVVYVANALNFGLPAETPQLNTFSVSLLKFNEAGTVSSEIGPSKIKTRKLNLSDLEISPFDEFVYLPAGRTLTKLAQQKTIMQQAAWPTPVPSMRSNYVAWPELLDDPRMQVFERQDRFICQLVLDMYLDDENRSDPHLSQDVGSRLIIQWTDPLAAILRPIWIDGHVTMRMVWAAQIAFDIHEICSGITGPRALADASRKIKDSFKFFVNKEGALDTQDVHWRSADSQNVFDIYTLATIHMVDPLLSHWISIKLEQFRRGPSSFSLDQLPPQVRAQLESQLRASGWAPPDPKHEETAERLRTAPIEPNEDLSFLVKANPLHAGTMLLDVSSRVEEAGIALANHHLSIFGAAHLYNAFIQLGLCDTRWPEMERIIELHVGPIFVHSVPTKLDDMASRFAHRTGVTARNPRRFNTTRPWKFETTGATQSLRKFFASTEDLSRVLSSLSSQAELHELQPYKGIRSGSTTTSSIRPQAKQKQIQVTPRQTLTRLGKYIDAVLPDIQIDYINMTRRCNAFLRRVRTQIFQEVGINYPVVEDGDDSNDHGLLFVVFAILEELNRATKVKSARRGGATEENDQLLEKAPQAGIAQRLLQVELIGNV